MGVRTGTVAAGDVFKNLLDDRRVFDTGDDSDRAAAVLSSDWFIENCAKDLNCSRHLHGAQGDVPGVVLRGNVGISYTATFQSMNHDSNAMFEKN